MKSIKKILSCLLAAALLCSIAVPANALDPLPTMIFLDTTGWKNVTTVYCHIWERGGDAFFGWQMKKEKCVDCGNGIYSYDVSTLDASDNISGGVDEAKDYCVIFSTNTGAQTYDATFGVECLGDTLKLTGEQIENPVDSEKTAREAVWTDNSGKYGPHLALTSIGNVVGSVLCPHENGIEVIGDWLPTYYRSSFVDPVKALREAYPKFSIEDIEDIDAINDYIISRKTGENEEYMYSVLLAAFDDNYTLPTDYYDDDYDFDFGVDNFTYNINSDGKTVSIFGYSGEDSVLDIPSTVTYDDVEYTVNEISNSAFYSNSNLSEVNIPDTITTIGRYAFQNCESLNSITIPDSVVSIGDYAIGSYDTYDEDEDEFLDYYISDFIIYGYENSAAHEYALENGLVFEKIGESTRSTEPAETASTPTVAPTEPVTEQPVTVEPAKPTDPKVTEPNASEPNESKPKVTPKKNNPITVTAKTKTVKAKKLKKKAQKIKALTVKNAQGNVTFEKVKSGTSSKIFKKITVNKKTGMVTLKKGKYAKKTYKVKIKITAKGNGSYNSKTINKTVKIKVK